MGGVCIWHGFCSYRNTERLIKSQKGATMPTFIVTSIIDGDTFEVSPQWKWNGTTGTRVRPTGYNAPELHAYNGQVVKNNLSPGILS